MMHSPVVFRLQSGGHSRPSLAATRRPSGGKPSSISSPYALLRLLTILVEIARAQHEALGKRGGSIALYVSASGQLSNRTAEAQFRDFKVFTLAP